MKAYNKSKSAKMRHEKTEGKREMMMEYGKKAAAKKVAARKKTAKKRGK